MFLTLALILGLAGGCAFWLWLIYIIIFHACRKRRLKTPAQMREEIQGYEGSAEPAADVAAEMPEPAEPYPGDIEDAENAEAVKAAAEKISKQLKYWTTGKPDAERIKYINTVLENIKRVKEERQLMQAAAEEYRAAVLLYPDIELLELTAPPAPAKAAASAEQTASAPTKGKKQINFDIEEV